MRSPRHPTRSRGLGPLVACLLPLALCARGAVSGAAERTLEIFAGSASKPATQELARIFEKRVGVPVHLHFGGSGAVLSQMELARRGDVYFPGSSDFMERAKRRGLVDPSTEVRVVYLLPAINVARGNPKGIHSLADLARPGIRVGMARPETVCVGLYGVEALERQGLADGVRPNVVNYAESCAGTAQMLSLGLVDAILGWDVFDDWDPDRIETVPLPREQVTRIGYIPAAISTFARETALAGKFLAFLAGEEGREVFRRHGYLVDLAEARRHADSRTPVGGEYSLPPNWNSGRP